MAARTQIEFLKSARKPFWSPPPRQLRCIAKRAEHLFWRRSKYPSVDDLARLKFPGADYFMFEVAIFFLSASSWGMILVEAIQNGSFSSPFQKLDFKVVA